MASKRKIKVAFTLYGDEAQMLDALRTQMRMDSEHPQNKNIGAGTIAERILIRWLYDHVTNTDAVEQSETTTSEGTNERTRNPKGDIATVPDSEVANRTALANP